jgi:hypothetical protein
MLMAKATPNKAYNIAAPDSMAVRLATRQRRKMNARFVETVGVTG